MFVRKNQRVYFSGRISSSPFTDEYPYPAVIAVLCAFASPREAQIFLLFSAPPRDANILLILSILSKILNPAPLRGAQSHEYR
jgi:hypothetical protein